jgi:hypothetical protein
VRRWATARRPGVAASSKKAPIGDLAWAAGTIGAPAANVDLLPGCSILRMHRSGGLVTILRIYFHLDQAVFVLALFPKPPRRAWEGAISI